MDIKQALTKCAYLVENAAKENCPVDTGRLRNSITHDVIGEEAIIGTNVEYAPYVEFGTGLFNDEGRKDVPWTYQSADGTWHSTSGQKPQPFLEPALDDNLGEISRILKEAAVEDFRVRLQRGLKDV